MTDNELGQRRPILLADSGDRFLAGVKVFARPAIQDGDLHFQYWIWYEQDRDHVGDWELVQIGVDTTQLLPFEVAYAQHRSGDRRYWSRDVSHEGRPVVYVSRDKHASYPDAGWHRHGRWRYERANGRREILYTFRIIDVDDARELSKPGKWGPDDNSPLSPGRQFAWAHPAAWARRFPIKH